MSCSEEETNAASVLSQMSQIQQSPSDTIESQGMSVAHQCDVETTTAANCSQEFVSMAIGHIIESCHCQEHLTTSTDLDGRIDKNTTTTTLEVSSGSVKVFQCEFCGKVFNKSYNLKTHHRVHTGERPFPCSLCGHGFANLGDLKRHTRTHTGEKPFTCEFCNTAFSDFGSHKRHLRLHTGFKPFKCEQCDRQFTRLDSFKNHARLHTGERPYKCEECQKEFNYLTTYKRHLNIHSGERPYSCNLCEKTFTRLSYLKNHKLNHGKLPSNAAQDDRIDETESASTAVMDSSRIPHITMSDVTNDSSQEKTADDHVIHQVAQALSQGGVQVSVTTVMDTSGTTQPILIETPDTGSNETSHTLILTQDILSPQSSANDNQQLLEFATDPNNTKSSMFVKNNGSTQERTETRQLFVTQSGQDFSTESQLLSASFDGVITVTEQQDGNIVKVNEQEKQLKDEYESGKNISEITTEHPEVGMATNINPNAVYITIEPEQTNVQQIIGELHVAVNSDSLIERN